MILKIKVRTYKFQDAENIKQYLLDERLAYDVHILPEAITGSFVHVLTDQELNTFMNQIVKMKRRFECGVDVEIG